MNTEDEIVEDLAQDDDIIVASEPPAQPIAAPIPMASAVLPAAVAKEEPLLSFLVFAKVSGKRPDQIAGFRRWVSSRSVGQQTLAQWKNLLAEFSQCPVK